MQVKQSAVKQSAGSSKLIMFIVVWALHFIATWVLYLIQIRRQEFDVSQLSLSLTMPVTSFYLYCKKNAMKVTVEPAPALVLCWGVTKSKKSRSFFQNLRADQTISQLHVVTCLYYLIVVTVINTLRTFSLRSKTNLRSRLEMSWRLSRVVESTG